MTSSTPHVVKNKTYYEVLEVNEILFLVSQITLFHHDFYFPTICENVITFKMKKYFFRRSRNNTHDIFQQGWPISYH